MTRIVDPDNRETRLLERLVDLEDARVLDLGCGDGRATFRMAVKAASVLGVDPDVEAIERARASAPEGERGRVAFLAEDVLALSLPDASFDVAVFTRSL